MADLLIAGSSAEVSSLIESNIREPGVATYFLGMEIKRNREQKTIKPSQKYTHDNPERLNVSDSKPRTIPTSANTKVQAKGMPLHTEQCP
jgi:hypothetical protein